MSEIVERALGWIVGDDTGISSETIWCVMMGVPEARPSSRADPPSDPSDFGRCYRLLSAIPEWRERLHEVPAFFSEWSIFVDRWGDMEALWLEEFRSGKCPKLYALMQRLWTARACRHFAEAANPPPVEAPSITRKRRAAERRAAKAAAAGKRRRRET